jgi:hypothetical protein
MISIDVSILYKMIRTIFSKRFRSPKRVLWTFIFILGTGLVYCLNVIGRLLDEIIFPGFRKVVIKPPLIIVANPRSGTTYLHRLLCYDENNFVYFKLYHTLLPSITIFRIIGFFRYIDLLIGGPLDKFIHWLDKQFFQGWEDIHPMGLNTAEEDEGLFWFPLATPALYMLFPLFREVPSLRFADDLPAWRRRALVRYYRSSVQRFLYATGKEDHIFLLKSVLYNGRMKIVNEIFPDARIVYLVRNPYEVLPSIISMFTTFWKVHSPDLLRDPRFTQEWARLGIDYYKYFHDNKDILDESNFVVLLYTELIQDPAKVIRQICKKFSIPLSQSFIEHVRWEAERHNNY